MSTVTSARPKKETMDSVYSNFDHVLDDKVMAELQAAPGKLCAQHAAWNFCGYVWFDGKWHDEVWRWHSPVEIRSGDDLRALIEDINEDYGSE